jgi:transcriptional regulator with XRE-family HTH domain
MAFGAPEVHLLRGKIQVAFTAVQDGRFMGKNEFCLGGDGILPQKAEVKIHRFIHRAGKLPHDHVYLVDLGGFSFLRAIQGDRHQILNDTLFVHLSSLYGIFKEKPKPHNLSYPLNPKPYSLTLDTCYKSRYADKHILGYALICGLADIEPAAGRPNRGTIMTFGQAIAEARKKKQLSQKELAALIMKEDGAAISPQYLNDIERDRRNPPGEYFLSQFAKVLNVPEEYFYFLANTIPPKYRSVSPDNPLQVREAFQAFARSYRRGESGKEK